MHINSFVTNPIIYHLFTDRFLNTMPDREPPYGRGAYGKEIGHFFGGTFDGIRQKIEDGWFDELGVNALLISAPYEQIHGWIPGGNGTFKHYAYHGYYAHDFTTIEKSFGSEKDFEMLVKSAHSHGLLVLLDVVLNHPGYPDLLTLSQYKFGAVQPDWEAATPSNYYTYLDKKHISMSKWWGRDWVRSDTADCLPGGDNDLTQTLFNLPDFRTESEEFVELPAFLGMKTDSEAKCKEGATIRDYLSQWICSWVRKYGIDGFRCDSAKHVEPETWRMLRSSAQDALDAWRNEQRAEPIGNGRFWMLGEIFGAGPERNSEEISHFDAVLNFKFQTDLNCDLELLYKRYALENAAGSNHFISFVSSHDSYLHDRSRLKEAALKLLLAPGGVLIFYGDETARPVGSVCDSDPAQSTRSPMNWASVDHSVLTFWRIICKFRSRHPSICNGQHRLIKEEPYTFSRFCASTGDATMVILDMEYPSNIWVGDLFLDGELLRNAFDGKTYLVDEGVVRLDPQAVVLLERAADVFDF